MLVHGAFADASSWNGVIERLQAQGVQVTAPANPLRGIAIDSAYIASVLNQIPGPVLAVGHSYGGAVISNAATNARNVVGLVFVAAFAPDEGERLGEVESASKDSILGTAQVPLRYPTGQGAETAVEFAINPAHFHEVFAADLPAEQAAVMAATQRPIAELAFSEPNGLPAWKTLALLGRGRDRRQGGRHRCRPFHGPARRGDDHRGRGLPRDHDLAATGRHGRDPDAVAAVGEATNAVMVAGAVAYPRWRQGSRYGIGLEGGKQR